MIQKLNQIANVIPGHPFRGRIKEKVGAGVYVVQLKDVAFGESIRWESCVESSPASKKDPDYLQEGDILFSARGDRYFAVLVSGLDGAQKYVAVPHFYVLRIKAEAVHPEFLVWLINQKPCQQYFEKHAEGSGTKSIRRTILAETPVSIPSLEKQQKIIHLDAVFRREQELVRQLLQNAEVLMSSISNDLYAQNKVQQETINE